MARALAAKFDAPLVSSTVSRLLIDLNRSLGHPQLYSLATRDAPAAIRAGIFRQYYRPYRRRVEQLVGEAVAGGRRVIHVSSHSFTPTLDGRVRNADIGLLYDPRRAGEAALCAHWRAALLAAAPALRVRRNYPYAGKGDGLTSFLRAHFAPAVYIGVELEVNQAIVAAAGAPWPRLRRRLIETLRAAAAATATAPH
jgi:predicted N-formylglutamate amidohydrolase